MRYTYQDMKDKTIEGIKKEVQLGLAKIVFYFYQTHGMPPDVFKDILAEKISNAGESLLFYMNFRNEHPEIFNE